MNPLGQKNVGTVKPRALLSKRSLPKLLKNSAGEENCCIFRVPRSTEKEKTDDYEPRFVSVGPYHHGKDHLQMIEEHKHGYLEFFMAEAKKKGVEMKDLVEAVSLLEKDIMDSYSVSLDLDRDKLIDMMVLDGCFVLTLFFKAAKKVQYTKSDDPIFKMRWILPAIRKDLLLLENQVPFIILQTLFDKSKIVSSSGLNEIAFEFFSSSIERLDSKSEENSKIKAKHLLDLIRKSFMPIKSESLIGIIENQEPVARPFLKLFPSAKKLTSSGLRLRPKKNAKTLLDVGFREEYTKVIDIPPIVLDDFIISVFRNCVAFEQFYGFSTSHISSYVAFMGCLITDEEDAMLLNKMRIIERYFGTWDEVAKIFKEIGKDISIDLHESYLAEVFEGVNKSIAPGFHVQMAEIKHNYFRDPMSLNSYVMSILLLELTVVQVFLAVLAYIDSRKGK